MPLPIQEARRTGTILPSELLEAYVHAWNIESPVAVDTETSGLFVDDGARVSTVSLAFADPLGVWANLFEGRSCEGALDGWFTYRVEEVAPGYSVPVASFAWPFDQGVSFTDKPEDDGYATMWPDAENLSREEWAALFEFLRLAGQETGLVFHNAKFDLHMLEAGTRRWPGLGWDLSRLVVADTQNTVALLYPTLALVSRMGKLAPTTSLKPNSAAFWGEAETDEQKVIKDYLRRKKLPNGRWDLMPWDVIAKYADQDPRLTLRIHLRAEHDIQQGLVGTWLTGTGNKLSIQQALDRRLDTTKFLYRMERRGLPFDTQGALVASKELRYRSAQIEDLLPFSPATLPRAKQYWFGDRDEGNLGFPPYAETDKGAPKVDGTVVDYMVRDNIPGAKEWKDLQKLATADSRWYAGYADLAGSDGRLRTSVRQNGTVSGRFSVERVQLQAIPQNYKLSSFTVLDGVPTPRALIGSGISSGWKMWELDLAQAELRVAAMYAKCQTMLDLIDQGADLHGETAKQLFDISPDDPRWDQMRSVAKRSNFSLIFGTGWETLQAAIEEQVGIRLSDAEAESLVRDWNRLYPEYKRAIYETKAVVERRMRSPQHGRGVGWIDTVNGERRWFVPGEDTHKAFNQRVQPNLAQFGIDWWLKVERRLVKKFGDDPVTLDGVYVGRVGMVMTIHDSMVLLLPDTPESLKIVEHAQNTGRKLWAKRFPGVPGDIDAKPWNK